MYNVCLFSHDQVTHDIIATYCSSNYNSSVTWADTDIRITVNTTSPLYFDVTKEHFPILLDDLPYYKGHLSQLCQQSREHPGNKRR